MSDAPSGGSPASAAMFLTETGYPDSPTLASGLLDVGDGHHLYWEVAGNPSGIPVVFLHGGPGAGFSTVHRRFFDPARYRIILFDQRGSGRSRPYASIAHNTTAHLVADLEVLRCHLGVDRWLLFGGSWGSTLALAYGQAHPERVLGFVLRGVFLCQQHEIDWFLTGMGKFHPESYQQFLAALPPAERGDLLTAYYHRLSHQDPRIHGPAAYAWASHEDACARLHSQPHAGPPPAAFDGQRGPLPFLAIARLEAHYMVHRGFMAEGALLAGLGRINHLPCIILQGRHDLVCPPETAWAVHQGWPGSTLTIIPDAGHSALEPGIRRGLLHATATMAERIQPGHGMTP